MIWNVYYEGAFHGEMLSGATWEQAESDAVAFLSKCGIAANPAFLSVGRVK